jgi:uncharacterized membrane protein
MGKAAPKSPLSGFHSLIRLHGRLFAAAGVTLVTAALLFAVTELRAASKILIAWDAGVAVYLAVTFALMAGADTNHIRKRACEDDEGAFALLVLPVAAAIASLAAIFAELSIAKRSDPYGGHSALAILTVLLSWTFIHTLFTLHYAHDFYGEGDRANGLEFPGKTKPNYWDFAYFSFVVGMTFQVSDVAVNNPLIRRVVWAHGVLSFVFNTAIIAVTVNLATNAI